MREAKEQKTYPHLTLTSGSVGIPPKTPPKILDSPTNTFQLSLPQTGLQTPTWILQLEESCNSCLV